MPQETQKGNEWKGGENGEQTGKRLTIGWRKHKMDNATGKLKGGKV